ncbi:excinuclease ABC subunit UvrC [Candidatus Xianfuyuplasma coldseepsis]|uniref:UvrABC system protein C n=1 Tax=Candidatus Xianfuyuplasma coldseepsis TaxID=2782163 RepID=A0A7L7KNX0_9MOLU|nr:excinuclease ABC subunit UvrC [Xianfuyuplasma coldseepsis]QMS84357.1 excinuclease ABC subunit UvrC [Xianfuyuplasma coldseepsis]
MSFKDKVKMMPDAPGSYQFKDKNGVVIYVGKAKSLKKRVSSYFTGSHDTKTSRLIMNIADIEYIVTSSELDALLLELNLIKKYNPRYNIMLTDDKTYPYIEITNERHPKVVVTRNIKKKSRALFGPYPNVKAARDTVKLLNKIYPLRKCDTMPKQACLYYHMGQCLAPCIKSITKEDYAPIIQQIKQFLRGDISHTITQLEEQMLMASERLEFERAQEYKKTIESIKTTTNRQKINLNDMKDRDIIGFYYNDYLLSIEIFFIRNGKISARHQKLFEYYDDPAETVENYLAQFYSKEPVPKEIFVQEELHGDVLHRYLDTNIVKPQRGAKRKLLNLAILNAEQSLQEKTEIVKRDIERTTVSMETLGELLNISTPYRIEAFDNSNLFGENAVSSMVVFINGKPARKEYRKFKVKTLDNKASDYHTMKEILYRRYYRVLMDNLDHPGLILVDGGLQQINAANEVLDSLDLDIPLAGLVKDTKHNTNHLLTKDLQEIELDKTSDVFHFITRIQDEAHRFAINYHKQVRSKGLFHSILDDIPKIGPVTKQKLLQKYKSVQLMKLAPLEELKELGLTDIQAQNLLEYLSKDR